MVAEPVASRPHPYLWRFMIDWRHQGRGIGRAALAALAEQRAAAGATHLLLSCVADVPGSPEPFYTRLGFERTGHVNEWGETEMIAALSQLIG
jgi:GNAT superfamily N-acetyltransferase